MNNSVEEVRRVLQQFQDGYTARDLSKLERFMDLISQTDDIELIGIGASVRGGNEWFQGVEAIREIVESDWTYWGDVRLDVQTAKITVLGEVAWLSTAGVLVQTRTFDKALPFYLQQMRELLEDEDRDPDTQLMEATHFGLRRLRERAKGEGHAWPLVFTAVLLKRADRWRFHTLHWSMPVD